MGFTTIKYQISDGIGIITLNRPERMNAVIEEMYQEIEAALLAAFEDVSVRAIIISGSSFHKNGKLKQAFCAGADLKKHSTGERSPEAKRQYITLAHDTCRLIYEFPKPVIAKVNGAARGAGSEMALSCDFILMADDATIAFPETGLGTCVGGGVTKHLAAVTGLTKAKELIYTGRVLDGHAAVLAGIALESLPIDELDARTMKLAGDLAQKAPVSMLFAKRLIQASATMDVKSALEQETEAILECMKTEDWHEGIKAFSEKRQPVYKGK